MGMSHVVPFCPSVLFCSFFLRALCFPVNININSIFSVSSVAGGGGFAARLSLTGFSPPFSRPQARGWPLFKSAI